MSPRGKVFLIGPGFIGGEVLDILLSEHYDVTTMVRRDAAAKTLQATGAKTVLGTLDDKNLISETVSESDVVFQCATADHLPSVEAVLDGITKRAECRASLLGDDSKGDFKTDVIFYDASPQQIDALPDTAPHRLIDLAIVRARERLGKKAKVGIVIPPVTYGVSTREKRMSIQIPTLARFALKHDFAGHIGKGLSVWSQVHVADLARAYVLLLHWLEGDTCGDIYTNPSFFCENGTEHSWGDCATEIGKALHGAGRLRSSQPKTLPEELYGDVFASFTDVVVGSNARNRADRLWGIGWQPREKSTFQSLYEDEIPVIPGEKQEFQGYGGVVAS